MGARLWQIPISYGTLLTGRNFALLYDTDMTPSSAAKEEKKETYGIGNGSSGDSDE